MSCSNYWRESALELLCDVGVYNLFTEEQLKEFSEGIESIADNEGTYTGRELIPDPRNEEIRSLEKKVKEYSDDKDNIIRCFSHITGVGVRFNERTKEVEVS